MHVPRLGLVRDGAHTDNKPNLGTCMLVPRLGLVEMIILVHTDNKP